MWSLRLLGDLSAERGGDAVTLTPRKYTALLAYLALHPARRFGRDELAAEFWPDSDDEAGRAALRTALSTLRRDFGADLFDTGGTGETIRLSDRKMTTDVAQFEVLLANAGTVRALPERETAQLEAAVSLYCGPLLPGIYTDWAVAERERLAALHHDAVGRLDALKRSAAAQRDSREQDEARTARLLKASGPSLRRLPIYAGPYIGRAAAIERLTLLLCAATHKPRVLTLTGPGGIGKTRFAVEAANTAADHFSGAVCFVPLSALVSGEEIGVAIADALQIENSAGTSPLQQAIFRLSDLGPSLIVLDNMEQIAPIGAAQAVKTLLASLPQVTLLITSRRLIGVDGEMEFPVTALSEESGRQLFLACADAAGADETGRDQETLRALCERLEGIPLAIELCASWSRVLSDRQMLEHLNQRFRLLVTRRQDVLAHHRSLHATLEWGCPTDPTLLSFFAALSVFRGGWTLEAAEAVGGADALEHTASLRENSLIIAEPSVGGVMRYRMLETIREFAEEKLTEEAALTARRAHLAYLQQRAAQLAPGLIWDNSAGIFAALDQETTNFRAAIEFGLSDTGESVRLALALLHSIQWCWRMRGHYLPHEEWKSRFYARRNDLPDLERARVIMDYAYYRELDECEALLRQAQAIFDRIAHQGGRADVREGLAGVAKQRGDYPKMEAHLLEVIAIKTASDDLRGASYSRANYAAALYEMGRVPEARELWDQCRTFAVAQNEVGSLAVLDRAYAVSLLDEGRSAEALPLLLSALDTFRHKGESWQALDTIAQVAKAFIADGRPAEALPVLREGLETARERRDEFFVERLTSFESKALSLMSREN